MRRKPGTLLPLEISILRAAIDLAMAGRPDFHGYAVATQIREEDGRRLTAQGTLYRALGRMEDGGLLESAWEDPAIAEAEERPRRRLYRVTAQGEAAYQKAGEDAARPLARLRPAEAPE